MKTLLLSDIHSNIYALEAIWQAERDSDLIYCAGDLVDYGPYPKEVLDWIRAHAVPCVQGNHDAWVVKNYRDGRPFDTMPVAERAWVHHNASLLNKFVDEVLVQGEEEVGLDERAILERYNASLAIWR